jgi:hypothetical protein
MKLVESWALRLVESNCHTVTATQLPMNRSDHRDQLHMVWARQVSDGAGPSRRGQLHVVHGWKVPDRVRSSSHSHGMGCGGVLHNALYTLTLSIHKMQAHLKGRISISLPS